MRANWSNKAFKLSEKLGVHHTNKLVRVFRNQEALVSIGKEFAHLLINGWTRIATLMLSVDMFAISDITMCEERISSFIVERF